MKKAIASVCLIFSVFTALPVAASEGGKAESIKGEILDLACYLGHGKKGKSHASCAKTCVKEGQPMGLLGADGKVYLLAADHSNGKAFNEAKEFAGKMVEITGTKAESSGITMVTVTAVSEAK